MNEPIGLPAADEKDPRLETLEEDAEKKLKKAGVRFPGIRHLRALLRFFRDSKQPWSKRLLAAAGILYFLSPFDLVPDFLPGGFLDDVAVLALVVCHLDGAIKPYLDGEGGAS